MSCVILYYCDVLLIFRGSGFGTKRGAGDGFGILSSFFYVKMKDSFIIMCIGKSQNRVGIKITPSRGEVLGSGDKKKLTP